MSNALTLVNSDRLLILAPHPDDESIATGGLVQAARSANAAVRVVVLTDGDNNPWPQRWMERRWRIDAGARARWGARRREEARTAIRRLGLQAEDSRFLGLPDLGLTDLLMGGDAAVRRSLRTEFEEFSPTLLAFPALSDRHPDHSAAHILARLVLEESALPFPRMLSFAVHGGSREDGLAVILSGAQRETKRAAILAHDSQMRLSSRRFLGYAGERENYQVEPTTPVEDSDHPLRARMDAAGLLHVRLDRSRWRGSLRDQTLFIALLGGTRLLRRLPSIGQNTAAEATIDCGKASPGYVKLARPQPGWRVFDRYGWQVIGQG